MSEGIDLAELAMVNDMKRMQVISHNLANVSTAGYKRDAAATVIFESQLLASQQSLVSGLHDYSTPGIATRTVHEPGTLSFTGNPLDIAINGDGFFAIDTADGEAYSRGGSFRLDASGQLVTAAGWPVQSESGSIRLTGPEPRIDEQGGIWEGENFMGRLRLARFANPEALEKNGGGYFLRGSAAPALAIGSDESLVRQGYLENSNVEASQEMVKLLEVIRHFEASQRLIRSYDDILQTAISTIADF